MHNKINRDAVNITSLPHFYILLQHLPNADILNVQIWYLVHVWNIVFVFLAFFEEETVIDTMYNFIYLINPISLMQQDDNRICCMLGKRIYIHHILSNLRSYCIRSNFNLIYR